MNTKQQIKLSILICSIKKRKPLLDRLTAIIQPQIKECIECIIATDNGQMKIGAKRNFLVNKAQGEYITFIDDDDIVSNDYIERILSALHSSPDIVVFDAFRFENGNPDRIVKYSLDYHKDSHDRTAYYRMPNHLMCVKKSIAEQVPFKHLNFGEDSDYAYRLRFLLKTQERIDEILYQYLYVNK